MDMGLERHVVAGALTGIVAQRLVRTICQHCKVERSMDKDRSEEFGFEIPRAAMLVEAPGCPQCMHTGFRGRAGLFDVVEVDDELRDLLRSGASRRQLKERLRRQTLPTVRRRGVELALNGLTTLDEVLRVT